MADWDTRKALHKVQGGYVSKASDGPVRPPKGGSGAKPPKK